MRGLPPAGAACVKRRQDSAPRAAPPLAATGTAVVEVAPLTCARFPDLEALFATKGCAFARGCWCMFYRESGRQSPLPGTTLAELRKARFRALAAQRPAPGLLGYDAAGVPIGWVTLGPRDQFTKLARSRVMKPVDAQAVWSIMCFVVAGPMRGRGVAAAMLVHAVDYARTHGAVAVEAYPVDKPARAQPQWLWHGAKSMFDRAGFIEVARRTPERPVMRLSL